MDEPVYEIMVMVKNSEDFLSWSSPQKLRFYEKAVEWHKYISKLMKRGEVIEAWGTQKLPGRVTYLTTKTLMIAIYKTTFDRFSELISQDPLWDYAIYHAPILKSLEGDLDDDEVRHKRYIRLLEDRLGRSLPEPRLKYLDPMPDVKPGGKMDVLIYTGNELQFGLLPDEQRIEHDERVLQMHDYHRMLRESGKIVREWGTYQNCGFGLAQAPNSKGGMTLFRVNNYDEFDSLFQSDPIRDDSRVQTIVLIPFEESIKRSLQDLKNAKNRLKTK